MDRPTCGTCPYWDPLIDESGLCMRHAPRPILMGQHAKWAADEEHRSFRQFPHTAIYDWCGEHPRFDAYIAAARDDCAPEHTP
jgi:hypothetical protein